MQSVPGLFAVVVLALYGALPGISIAQRQSTPYWGLALLEYREVA